MNKAPSIHFFRFILAHPRSVIGAVVALTLFWGWQMRKVTFNNSINALLPENHPAVQQDQEVKDVFDSREMILIGVLHERGIFNPSTLEKIKALTEDVKLITITGAADVRSLRRWSEELTGGYSEAIRAILEGGLKASDRGAVRNLLLDARADPAADSAFVAFLYLLNLKLSPINDVASLAEADHITSTDGTLRVASPLEEVLQTEEELAELAQTVFGNEMLLDGLVARDSTGTLILAELAFHYSDNDALANQVFEALETLAASYRGPEQIRLAGVPMVNVYTSSFLRGDLARLTPLVILMVLILLYVSLRMLRGALLPLAIILVALVWTLGLMGMMGRPITMLTSAMPVMLIAIGVADGVHVINEYRLQWARLRERERAILATMAQLDRPVFFASLTTMVGFASLATADLRTLQDFGLFTAAGVLADLVLSLTLTPAALTLMKPPRTKAHEAWAEQTWLTIQLEHLGAFVLHHRRSVVLGTVGLGLVSTLAITQLKVGSTMVGYFHQGSEIYRSSQMLNAHFGGTEMLNIVIDTKRADGLKDPAVLAGIAALQDTLEVNPLVGYTLSLADLIRRMNLVLHEHDARYNRIPAAVETVAGTEDGEPVEEEVSGQDLIAQYLLLYENAGGSDLEQLADYDYRKANLVVQIRTDYTPDLRRIRRTAATFAAARFGPGVEVSFAGCSNLCIVGEDLIVPSQLKSISAAFFTVFFLFILTFRSLKYSLIGIAPMVLTVVLVFVIMAAFSVHLDAATALIASIVLGTGDDYSIHFISRYRSLRDGGLGAEAAIRETLHSTGRSITFDALSVGTGFLVLLLSSFWAVMHIGWLVAANLFIIAFLTLFLLPGLLQWSEKKQDKPVPLVLG